jgi:zinc transporter 1
LDGVISVHELHVWQLSDTKLIASLHVLLRSREGYMLLGSEIRKLLHGYGIHSATIQPEFIEDQLDEKKVSPHLQPIEDDNNSQSNKVIIHHENTANSPTNSALTDSANVINAVLICSLHTLMYI